jgi:hypothetical protein
MRPRHDGGILLTDLFPRLRRWWDSARSSWSGRRVPYAVACRCGHTLQGQRRRRHQVVACPSCGASVFVLPYSAYPAAYPEDAGPPKEGVKPSAKARRSRLRAWRLPLLAALVTLAVAVAFFLWILPRLNRSPAKTEAHVPPARKDLDRLMAEGKRALADSKFPLALEKFEAATKLLQDRPDLLDEADSRRLNQLYWQSDLLAKELELTLVQLLKKANDCDTEAEWQAQFRLQYRGKRVVFYDVVERRQGRPVLREGAEVRWGKVRGRVALDDLKLLDHMPLEPPKRWLFGARLASFNREGEEWVIRFDPDSGVLVTDAGAATAWNPALRDDPRLADVLKEQSKLSPPWPVPDGERR